MPKHMNLPKVMHLDMPQSDRLLTTKETAQLIGMNSGTLARARITGAPAPPWVKIGASVRYKLSSVLRWISDQTEHTSTSHRAA